MSLLIELTDKPEASARDVIGDPLLEFNVALLGQPDIRPLAVLLRSESNSHVVGGLWGRTSFRWLFVELLFVPEEFRGQHLGTKLLELVESKAKQRDCLALLWHFTDRLSLSFYKHADGNRFHTAA